MPWDPRCQRCGGPLEMFADTENGPSVHDLDQPDECEACLSAAGLVPCEAHGEPNAHCYQCLLLDLAAEADGRGCVGGSDEGEEAGHDQTRHDAHTLRGMRKGDPPNGSGGALLLLLEMSRTMKP
jgi:hypothetical protein